MFKPKISDYKFKSVVHDGVVEVTMTAPLFDTSFSGNMDLEGEEAVVEQIGFMTDRIINVLELVGLECLEEPIQEIYTRIVDIAEEDERKEREAAGTSTELKN